MSAAPPQLEKSTATDEQPAAIPTAADTQVKVDRYREGFYDCIAEVLRFLAVADRMPVDEMLKVQMLDHLNRYFTQSPDNQFAKFDLISDTKLAHSAPTPPRIHQYFGQSDVKPMGCGDEPLNMSVKRPRAEYPAEVVMNQKGSQLRDILESRPSGQITSLPFDQRQRQTAADTPKSFASNSPPFQHQSDLLCPQPLNYSAKSLGGATLAQQKRILQCDSTCDPYSLPPAYLSGLLSERNGPNSVTSSLQYPSSPSDTTSSGDSSEFASPPASLVPIFALHPAGLFYVPLAIPTSQLEAAGYGRPQNLHSNSLSSLIQSCHPVTISVQFDAGRQQSDVSLKRRGDEFIQQRSMPVAPVAQKSFLPKSAHLPDPSFNQPRHNDIIPPQSHFARTNVILAPASSSDNRQLRAQNF